MHETLSCLINKSWGTFLCNLRRELSKTLNPQTDECMRTLTGHASFLQPEAGNKLDEANYGAECDCAKPDEIISQKHIQSHPDTSMQTLKQAKTHRNSQIFALRGQESTSVCKPSGTRNTPQVNILGHFCVLCVCVGRHASARIPLCADVWTGVYLFSVKQTGGDPDAHITGEVSLWVCQSRAADLCSGWRLC